MDNIRYSHRRTLHCCIGEYFSKPTQCFLLSSRSHRFPSPSSAYFSKITGWGMYVCMCVRWHHLYISRDSLMPKHGQMVSHATTSSNSIRMQTQHKHPTKYIILHIACASLLPQTVTHRCTWAHRLFLYIGLHVTLSSLFASHSCTNARRYSAIKQLHTVCCTAILHIETFFVVFFSTI